MEIIGMMIGDIVVYSLLALYFESVFPSEHGVRRPWYLFHFREIFKETFGNRRLQEKRVYLLQTTIPESNQVAPETSSKSSEKSEGRVNESNNDVDVNESFEPEGMRDTPVGIEVQNIFKNFGRKRAVVGVSFKMYKGDIFALLGHNGAGKTTLISIITGFFSPSKGTAIVDGHDIRYDMANARKKLGLCPQHNMLFDGISVMDQLIIFGMVNM